MTQAARLVRIACVSLVVVVIAAFVASGIFPFREYVEQLAQAPATTLTAAVVPADVASLTNTERLKNGLAPLAVNPLLTQAAQLKADDMAKNEYYAHTSPDGKSPLYWLNLVGYKYLNAGENLVIDRKTSEQAVDAWMNSPEHRENILRPQFTQIGIGVASGEYDGINTIFVVQEFGTPYPFSVSVPSVAQAKPAPVPTPAGKPAPVVATTPSTAITPTLSVTPLPQQPIIAEVKNAAAPIVEALTTQMIPSKPSVEPAATSTATSTISYTLAPEFFAPVSIATNTGEAAQLQTLPRDIDLQKHPKRPDLLSNISSFIRSIGRFMMSSL